MNFDDMASPLYLQLYDEIEDNILKEIFKEEEKIPSTTDYSVNYNINPATVRKAFDLLSYRELIYKKRGIGMFVKEGSVEKIKIKRREEFFKNYIEKALEEGEKLGINKNEIIEMVERG